MKKILILATMMAMVAGIFYSCTKSEKIDNQNNKTVRDIIKVVNLSSTKGDITMLSFSSLDLFDQTIDDLRNQINNHLINFKEANSELDEEQLVIKEVEDGFHYYQPLEDFENNYNFTSLRIQYQKDVDKWLSNTILDENKDPDKNYVFEEEMLCLLNPEWEVMINGAIYKFSERGYVIITDGDIPTLIRVRENDPTVYEEDNISYSLGDEEKRDCDSWVQVFKYDYYASSRYVRMKVSFHKYSWKVTTKSKIVSFKYYNTWIWSGWRRYSMPMTAQIICNVTDDDCNYLANVNLSESDNANHVKALYSWWGSFLPYKAEKYKLIGIFAYAGKTNKVKW